GTPSPRIIGCVGLATISASISNIPASSMPISRMPRRYPLGYDQYSRHSQARGRFVETLAAGGAKRIYGIVGDSLNGLTDAIRRQGKIEWLHVRHEEVAAFAAGAEVPLTGELAV